MTILQIIGITLAAIIVLTGFILFLNIKLCLEFSKGNEPRFFVKVLFFSFGKKKKNKKEALEETPSHPKKKKKPNRFIEKLKKRFGLDIVGSDDLKQNVEETGISDTVNKAVTIVMLLAGRIKWLFTKLCIDKLRIFAICSGGDAADAAMDYGIVCAAVYPLVGYLTESMKTKKNAEDVRIGCDFDGDSHFEFNLVISVKTIYIVRAVLGSLFEMAEAAQSETNAEVKHEQH